MANTCGREVTRMKTREIKDLANQFTIDKIETQQLLDIMTAETHPFGSARQKTVTQAIQQAAKKYSNEVAIISFDAETPNPELIRNPNAPSAVSIVKTGYNVVANFGVSKKSDCAILIGSHSDTKDRSTDNFDYLGANDSGSTSAILIQMLRFAREKQIQSLPCEMFAVWFDGEESVLDGWDQSEHTHPSKIVDHTYGSTHFANSLVDCHKGQLCLPKSLGSHRVIAVIVIDMLGSPNVRFTRELHSSPKLRNLLNDAARELDLTERLGLFRQVEDDHVPFLKRGVQALNLIDFENLEHWHSPTDVTENVSMESLEISGKLASFLALSISSAPQEFVSAAE
jgi:Zn-dependent M28 family amino/carboxypeptidase